MSRRKSVHRIREQYGLSEYSKEDLRNLAKKNRVQAYKIRYRERLLESGQYEDYRTEIFRNNIVKVLSEKKDYFENTRFESGFIKPNGKPVTYTISDLIRMIRKLPLKVIDAISQNIRNFVEAYREDIQEEYDMEMIDSLFNEIYPVYQDRFKNQKKKPKIVKNRFRHYFGKE